MRLDLEKKLHVYMLAGGSPAKWIAEAIARGLIDSGGEVLAALDKWHRAGWYDFGLCRDDGWLTAAGAAADVGRAQQEAIEPKEAA